LDQRYPCRRDSTAPGTLRSPVGRCSHQNDGSQLPPWNFETITLQSPWLRRSAQKSCFGSKQTPLKASNDQMRTTPEKKNRECEMCTFWSVIDFSHLHGCRQPFYPARSLQWVIQTCLWVDTLAPWAPGEVLHAIESGWLHWFLHNIALCSLDHRLFQGGGAKTSEAACGWERAQGAIWRKACYPPPQWYGPHHSTTPNLAFGRRRLPFARYLQNLGGASHLYAICSIWEPQPRHWTLSSCTFPTCQSSKYYPKSVHVLPIAYLMHASPLFLKTFMLHISYLKLNSRWYAQSVPMHNAYL